MRDNTLLPIERAKIAMNKFERLSSSEIVTPTNVVKKVVNLLPIDKFTIKNKNIRYCIKARRILMYSI